jgi:protein-tyrosine phosphatase
MVDLHSHILAGIDDGARTLEESIEIARAAVADGTSLLAATPHVRDDFPTAAQTMERLVRELNLLLEQKGIDLRVLGGAEISIERLRLLDEDELRRLALAGNPRYLLIEFPYVGWPLSLESDIRNLRRRGITPVIAHPERNPEVQANPERIMPLVSAGALIQLTAGSVDGRLGRQNRRTAMELIGAEHAHLIAGDAHWPRLRRPGLSGAAGAVGDPELGHWLIHAMPAAIVENAPLAERPESKRRKGAGRILSKRRR